MKRPELVSRGTLNRIFQEVNELWKGHEYEAATTAMERALRLDPANVGILLDLAGMYGRRYSYEAAENCFERAIQLSGQKVEVMAAAGKISQQFGSFNLAEIYLNRAVATKNPPPDVIVKLAEIHERLRRPDAARSLVDQAISVSPNFAPALILRAKLDRLAGHQQTAEKQLREFPHSAESALQASAAYELGNLLDKQGRYEEAMSAFFAAKEHLRPHAGPYLAELKATRARIRKMQDSLTTDTMHQWLAQANDLAPLKQIAFLTGHPRSGTTLLEQVLDTHPEITSLEETEIFHTDAYLPLARNLSLDAPILDIMEAADSVALQSARTQYFKLASQFMKQPIGNRLLLDKNPSLTFLIPVILRVFPEAKIIVVLRDPRDVVLSCFMQSFELGVFSSPYLTLKDTVEDYCLMMSLWLKIKPMIKGQFIEIRYEDMVDNLEDVAGWTLNFLKLNWNLTVLDYEDHARAKLVRSPTYSEVTQPIYRRAKGRWRNYQKYIAPSLSDLEPFLKALGYE